ncbi:MAG: hypothetical protein P4L43_12570 [Syntrophobacteraceae bacterium]|nr:hypothetical protein [Syntrophobacteraceae bacterium]
MSISLVIAICPPGGALSIRTVFVAALMAKIPAERPAGLPPDDYNVQNIEIFHLLSK